MLKWFMSFAVPFTVAIVPLVICFKDAAYNDLQRARTELSQACNLPDDNSEALKSAVAISAIYALPVGAIGVGVYGSYRLLKRSRLSKSKAPRA